jgi:type II secretory pathway pseudopilin PulG
LVKALALPVSPNRVSPNRVSPNRVSPNRSSQQRETAKHVRASGIQDLQGDHLVTRLAPIHNRHARLTDRSGVTLIELLVSVALTLIVILAIVRVFDLLGGNVNKSRSILELSAQLRTAANQLQTDLDRLTVKPNPPADPLSAPGYFEIIEGKRSDANTDGDDWLDTDPADIEATWPPIDSPVADITTTDPLIFMTRLAAETRGIMGDVDDVWMGTIRSPAEPFRGRFLGQIIESPLAEVVWWVEPILGPGGLNAGATELVMVRRILLILPNPDVRAMLAQVTAPSTPAELIAFLRDNDLSVRPDLVEGVNGAVPGLKANTLADLTYRRNRFAHWSDQFMQSPLPAVTFPDVLNRHFLVRASDRSDLIANDVLAMDVRVFDPLAPVIRPLAASPYVLTPIDPGFRLAATQIDPQTPSTYPESHGAYVDLGYNVDSAGGLFVPVQSHFSGPPQSRSRTWAPALPNAPRVYCTWSTMYERDGIDQNNNGLFDEGTDGFDTQMPLPPEYTNSPYLPQFVVDDAFERETSPPYPRPLRGVEVVLRLRELSTQQVRQASVLGDFVAP